MPNDYFNAETGIISPDDIRSAEVEALVDAGANMLVLPADVLAENAGTMPLIGQVLLEELDLIVDLRSKELRPNPESPDMPMIDVF